RRCGVCAYRWRRELPEFQVADVARQPLYFLKTAVGRSQEITKPRFLLWRGLAFRRFGRKWARAVTNSQVLVMTDILQVSRKLFCKRCRTGYIVVLLLALMVAKGLLHFRGGLWKYVILVE